MTSLLVIPARLGATRLPRKPLRLLGGAPVIVRVWERVLEMGIADAVVVATDAEEIAAVIRERGGSVSMTRADHPSGTDRVAEVARAVEYAHCDVVVNVQGDEPFVSGDALRGAMELVQSGAFPVATAAHVAATGILQDPDVVKVVCDQRGRALYFSRAPIPFLRDARDGDALAAQVRQHLGIYVYTRHALLQWVALPVHDLERIERLEQLRPLAAGIDIGVATVTPPSFGGIDTEDDLRKANIVWNEHFAGHA